MKKLLFSAALACIGLTAGAQLVQVESIKEVALPEGLIVNLPTISPDGSFVVVSDMASNALTKIDLATGATSIVAENGSGLDLKISADGQQVVYRQSITDNRRMRYTGLKATNLATGATTEVVKPTRNLGGFEINRSGAISVVNGGKMVRKAPAGVKASQQPVASINRGHLEITVDGSTTTIDPQGKGSYLWPSISPDGTKVSYYLSGKGCYVCNLDGSNAVRVGSMRAPRWVDNGKLVGFISADNGEYVLASSLYMASLDGKTQKLTEDNYVAMYPTVSADGKQIAFSDNFGRLYVMNIR